jgi:adenylate kinase family enzyme
LIRREDDNEISVRERLKIYYKHEKDLLDFYVYRGKQIKELDVTKSLVSVFDDFKQLIGIERA